MSTEKQFSDAGSSAVSPLAGVNELTEKISQSAVTPNTIYNTNSIDENIVKNLKIRMKLKYAKLNIIINSCDIRK